MPSLPGPGRTEPISAPPLVRIRGLEKSYGAVRALAGLTLSLPRGPTGLLGPNGAGKTTLIQLLLGLLRPDAGEAEIAGCDPASREGRLELRRRSATCRRATACRPRSPVSRWSRCSDA